MLNSYETIRNLYIRTANVKAVLNAYKMRVISASEYTLFWMIPEKLPYYL